MRQCELLYKMNQKKVRVKKIQGRILMGVRGNTHRIYLDQPIRNQAITLTPQNAYQFCCFQELPQYYNFTILFIKIEF